MSQLSDGGGYQWLSHTECHLLLLKLLKWVMLGWAWDISAVILAFPEKGSVKKPSSSCGKLREQLL